MSSGRLRAPGRAGGARRVTPVATRGSGGLHPPAARRFGRAAGIVWGGQGGGN